MHDGHVFITATSGSNANSGQLWRYNPQEEQLSLVYESPSPAVLDMPDNIAVSPRGGVLKTRFSSMVYMVIAGIFGLASGPEQAFPLMESGCL